MLFSLIVITRKKEKEQKPSYILAEPYTGKTKTKNKMNQKSYPHTQALDN